MTQILRNVIRRAIFLAVITLPISAVADSIVIEVLPDGGGTPEILGGFEMTAFEDPMDPDAGCGPGGDGVYSTDSPIDGEVAFESQSGAPLCMVVQDPEWWEWDHGNVFTTSVNWVELVMPEQTRAFSLFVGANLTGRGWIEAIDASGSTTLTKFGGNTGITLGWGHTPGFGVYTAGSCSAITRIIVEPFEWGTGEFAINQDPCSTSVPEPGTLSLLGLGLLGLAFVRRRYPTIAALSSRG